jgi:hypothetical protein
MRNPNFTTGQAVVADAPHMSSPQEGTYIGFKDGLHHVQHWHMRGAYESHEICAAGDVRAETFIDTRGEW